MGKLGNPEAHELDPRIDTTIAYGGVAANVRLRFALYEHAVQPFDIEAGAIDALEVQPGDALLDVGCADGKTLARVSGRFQFPLTLVGLDIDPQLLAQSNPWLSQYDPLTYAAKGWYNVAGSAVGIPLRSHCIDKALALFVLYHAPQPQVALEELQRVVVPGGRLVVATSGGLNKIRHRQFEGRIAAYLSRGRRFVAPPPVFAGMFNTEKAQILLPRYFEVVKAHRQRTQIQIADTSAKMDYLLSLRTMKHAFSPEPTGEEWADAVEHVVAPVIDAAIQKQGYFSDFAARDMFVCVNTKSSVK